MSNQVLLDVVQALHTIILELDIQLEWIIKHKRSLSMRMEGTSMVHLQLDSEQGVQCTVRTPCSEEMIYSSLTSPLDCVAIISQIVYALPDTDLSQKERYINQLNRVRIAGPEELEQRGRRDYQSEKSLLCELASDENIAHICAIHTEFSEVYEDNIYISASGTVTEDAKCTVFLGQYIYTDHESGAKMFYNRKAFVNDLDWKADSVKDYFYMGKLKASQLASAAPASGKYQPDYIAVDSSLMGMIVHEAVGHALEADHVLGNSSFLKDRDFHFGEHINIAADPTWPNAAYRRFDDEGVAGGKMLLIEHGKVIDYLHSKQTAALMDARPNGHLFCEAYYKPPMVRMSSVYFLPDNHTESEPCGSIQEITAILRKGGYLEHGQVVAYLTDWSGGTASWASLEFDITVPMMYLISDNSPPVAHTNLSFTGNAAALLNSHLHSYGLLIVDTFGYCSKRRNLLITSDGGPELNLFKREQGIQLIGIQSQ
ncbi:metallopeptidase TldD-related protein [Paenibacillus tengchongensis]|uniref:metallopeptidase TldD-related protein n=1 Tax=Paenibacillus tengchongensis TaxID=2608684 RepID=UPI00124EB491|nr:metallopeptidase TldD-related protein [Paenibacillus tengchongensis]